MSMGQEIVSFLIPDVSQLIQMIFFTLMMSGTIVTIVMVKIHARPESWEKNWNGGTANDLSDDLDAEHGSVSDISNAVETRSEKLSEAMPGILLVLGLLGTFLGLGIALDKASTILVGASAAGMDDAMINLMGMMEGLGTKFKTSTWGIIAFLALKIWISFDGFEENRLRWCIRKVKGELDRKRIETREQQQSEHQQFTSSINQLGDLLCLTLQKELSGSRVVLQQSQDLLSKKLDLSTQSKAGIAVLANLLKLQLDKSGEMVAHSLATRNSLEIFVQANTSNLESMQQSSSQMADAAIRVGESAGDLKLAISAFKDDVGDVLGSLKKDLNETITQMSNQTTESAADLKSTIGNFQSGVSDVMTAMKSDLRDSISQMNDSFGRNMGEMSGDLKVATTGIAGAITQLSSSVEKTMTSVEIAIGESLAIQKTAQVEFLVTSGTLNENVGSMSGLVDKLQKDIKSGLQAVSESNRSVISLNSRYSSVTESIASLSDEIKKSIGDYTLQLNVINSQDELPKSFDAMVGILESIDTSLLTVIDRTHSKKETSESDA